MALDEKSFLWNTGVSGDGATPYTEVDAGDVAKILAACLDDEGVAPAYLNLLAATVPGANEVQIDTGAAMVDGRPYRNHGAGNLNIPSAVGGGNTRIDRIVLRADWSAREVRLHRIEGTDAASPSAPAPTQTPGTTYDLLLWRALVDTSGAVTLTDERVFARASRAGLAPGAAVSVIGRSANSVGAVADIAAGANDRLLARVSNALSFVQLTIGMFADNLVTYAKLAQSAGLSVLGRSANSTGNLAAITAANDGEVLRRSGTSLGFGTVSAAGLGPDSVDDTKAGNRVPQFYRRQGSSASAWNTAGTSTQTPTAVRMQAGVINCNVDSTPQNTAVTFPAAFSQAPIILLSSANEHATLVATSISASGFTISAKGPQQGTSDVNWLAIGPE